MSVCVCVCWPSRMAMSNRMVTLLRTSTVVLSLCITKIRSIVSILFDDTLINLKHIHYRFLSYNYFCRSHAVPCKANVDDLAVPPNLAKQQNRFSNWLMVIIGEIGVPQYDMRGCGAWLSIGWTAPKNIRARLNFSHIRDSTQTLAVDDRFSFQSLTLPPPPHTSRLIRTKFVRLLCAWMMTHVLCFWKYSTRDSEWKPSLAQKTVFFAAQVNDGFGMEGSEISGNSQL